METTVAHGDQVRGRALVILVPGYPSGLRAGRRGRIRSELTRQVLLELFGTLRREIGYAPKEVQSSRRGLQNVRQRRQVCSCRDCGPELRTALVGIEKDVPDTCDGILRSRALALTYCIDAHVYYVELGTPLLARRRCCVAPDVSSLLTSVC